MNSTTAIEKLYDWYIAQFELIAGGLLAMATGVVVAVLVGQMTGEWGAIWLSVIVSVLMAIWLYFNYKLAKLRQDLNRSE
ncbi:MAG: hypothetical protein JRN62_03880 [Nitrososphaerota archaeon]|jgi:hypothetical protein|nr:hypothetical protein [Nitrososphaerota archaeon]MDG6948742.1 hypothetical protein [Nitrososphaerota archaeon]